MKPLELVLAAAVLASILPVFVPTAGAANVSYTLKAAIAGWNATEPGGANPTLTVRTGDTVTITIEGVDSFHNWALYPGGTQPGDVAVWSPNGLQRTDNVSSGQTASVTFPAPPPGTYEYYCEFHAFQMHGQFVVTGAAADSIAPTIGPVSASPSVAVPRSSVNITATVTDNVGLSEVSVQVVGPNVDVNLTMTKANDDVWYANRSYDAVGTYSFTVWATDTMGNVASSSGFFEVAPSTGAPGFEFVYLGVGIGIAVLAAILIALVVRRRKKP